MKDGGCDKPGLGAHGGVDGRCGFIAIGGVTGNVGGFIGWGIVGGQPSPHGLFCQGSIVGLGGVVFPEGGVHSKSPVLQGRGCAQPVQSNSLNI